jgi:hypothetical protein
MQKKGARSTTMVAAAEARKLVNSKIPHSPPYIASHGRNVG